jgi:hypothetical protein
MRQILYFSVSLNCLFNPRVTRKTKKRLPFSFSYVAHTAAIFKKKKERETENKTEKGDILLV